MQRKQFTYMKINLHSTKKNKTLTLATFTETYKCRPCYMYIVYIVHAYDSILLYESSSRMLDLQARGNVRKEDTSTPLDFGRLFNCACVQ